MNIHEYQAKAIFSRFGVPVLDSHLVRAGDDIEQFCESLESHTWVTKAQVHAGGRGKAGGVMRADNKQDLVAAIKGMLGTRLVTRQTGEDGLPVQAVLIEKAVDIRRELYLALLVDRESGRVAIIASAQGGMDIEQVAQQTPDRILTQLVHPAAGLQSSQARTLAYALGLQKDQVRQLQAILFALFELFVSSDCSLVEINPLILDGEGRLAALDAKINIDDNALFRQAEIAKLRDPAQGNRDEEQACSLGLNYIRLGGNIGCIVNGAGLAMATMDLVKHHGGEPANFLDVGGAITQETVAEAFKLVVSDTGVKAVLVNIFGGIVRCDLLARGILDALQGISLKVPVVVLLQGTRAAEGRQLLENRHTLLHQADTLTEAAQRAIRLART